MNPSDLAQKLILFGPLPPPHNGHTLAFQMCVRGCREHGLRYRVIDYSPRWPGMKWFPFSRIAEYGFIMGRYFRALLAGRRGTVYITLNQAVDGLCRDLILMRSAQHLGFRVIVHIHGGWYDEILRRAPAFLRNAAVAALAACDAVILLSDRLRFMFDAWPEVQRRVRVVPNGLPFEPTGCPTAPKTIRMGEPVRLLFLSNMIESKGWPVVLEAVERLVHHHGLNVRARFCGGFMSSPEDTRFPSPAAAKDWFDTYIREHDLETCVHYDSRVDGDEKIRALQEAHFLLLPSAYPNEGQPLALIEGLAYGCVLVGTPYRAIPDMVSDGNTGLLCPADPVWIADGVASLFRDPDCYRRMSSASLELYKRQFQPEIHIQNIVNILSPIS
ncbi:MAG TPA: glycosyltransferase family 4 protein [Candidatus Ozemobacteraceae bacterium]|nr:glycosyltransferase family 4 protein [Candidatus Ozemobacteraceae bacterium]